MVECLQHDIKKMVGNFFQCKKCGMKLVEYNKGLNIVKCNYELNKENKKLNSCLRMLKICAGANKITDKYIEKKFAFAIIESSGIDEIKAKEIYTSLGIHFKDDEYDYKNP